MTTLQALLAFSLAAALLTVTPGLDTALVLRTAAVEGARRAVLAAVGVVAGCLAWGAAVALGLGVLLAASTLAFTVLKWVGAVYLIWLGLNLLLRPRRAFESGIAPLCAANPFTWLRRGFLSNLLNPKIGVFYVSFLPQFLPAALEGGAAAGPFIFLLAALHGLMGLAWFALLIGATTPISALLQRPSVVGWLDRITGGVFIGFGLRLALERR